MGSPRSSPPSGPPSTPESQKMEEALLQPYTYVVEGPSKGVRQRLIDSFNLWLEVEEGKVAIIKSITEKLHNASLLIDDIEDNSEMRRGKPASHTIFGVPATINCGNFIYFLAMQDAVSLSSKESLVLFIDEMANLHRGQGMDIHWRDNKICPSEEDYKVMVQLKTGGLFRLTVRLMQEFSTDKRDYTPLLNDFAVYFQILDDYLNLKSTKYHVNKSFCEDITEGKYSFPIIHSIRSAEGPDVLSKILAQGTESEKMKRFCLQKMEETHSFAYTLGVLNAYHASITQQISDFGGNQAFQKILDTLHQAISGEGEQEGEPVQPPAPAAAAAGAQGEGAAPQP